MIFLGISSEIFLILVFILSFNFQNVLLKDYLGTIGAAGINYFFPLVILGLLNFFVVKKDKVNYLDKKIGSFFIYMFIVSMAYVIYVAVGGLATDLYGENFFIKSFKLILYNVIGFLSIGYFSRIISKVSRESVKKLLNINFIFIFIVFMIEKLQNIERIKLLTSEPSEAGYILTIFYILLLSYNKRDKSYFLIGLSTLVYLVELYYIGSKGAIVCFFISLGFFCILTMKFTFKRIILSLFLFGINLFVLRYFFYEKLSASIMNDLKYFTSVITRSWSVLTSLKIFSHNIFGVGGTYLFYFEKEGTLIQNILENKFNLLNYTEIKYSLETGHGMSPKSGIFMDIILYGIGSIYFYIAICKYFYKGLVDSKVLKLLLIFTMLSMLIFIDKYMTPTYILVFTILQSEILRNEDIEEEQLLC